MEKREHIFRVLVRQFWDRFFDAESLSPQGDAQANVAQTLGILAVPSAFFVLLFRPLTLVRWELVAVRYMFVSFSMIVMGFLMVLEWDALVPDARDYQVLTPLPLRARLIMGAKAAALGCFLAVFLLDINFFGVILWPGIDARPGTLHTIASHVAAVVSGGLFAALAIAAVQGILIAVLPVRVFQRVTVVLQTLLVTVLIALLVLTPLLAFRVRPFLAAHHPLLRWLPTFWFVGFYERLRPAVGDRGLLALGNTAVYGLCVCAAAFVLAYVPLYQRRARKFLEAPAPNPAGPGVLRNWFSRRCIPWLVRDAVERAVFHFMNQTIARSMKHRMFLAAYAGLGIALAIMSLLTGASGLLRLPLTLSFILVSGLRAAFNFPSELRANWIFQLSETERPQAYLAAMRKWIVVCAIMPLFLLLAPIEFACFSSRAALFHLMFGFTLSVLLMDVLFLGFRKIPFTCAYYPGKVNMVGLSVIYVLGFTVYSRTMAAFEELLYAVPVAAAVFFAVAAGTHLLLAYMHGRRLRAAAAIDYDDAGDPLIRTLQLTS